MKRLLKLSGFNLSPAEVNKLVAMADTNHDGVIEYEEFIPVALGLLQAEMEEEFVEVEEDNAAREFLLQGMPEEQLVRKMKKLFLMADEDCSGFLDFPEFKNCLNQMGLPLTAAQTSEVMSMLDTNKDGYISYEEFIPAAFELFVKVVSGKIQPKAVYESHHTAPPARRAVPSQGWTAYKNMYEDPTAPVDVPVQKVTPTRDNSDVASLEGRVLAVQSRRIIRSKIKDLFARYDTDKDGRLTFSEVTSALGDSVATRIRATTPAGADKVTQFEMRRFLDDECSRAVERGVPEYKFLENIVEMLESAF
jgi:Ca2+-binding EF-hand superfamily protein